MARLNVMGVALPRSLKGRCAVSACATPESRSVSVLHHRGRSRMGPSPSNVTIRFFSKKIHEADDWTRGLLGAGKGNQYPVTIYMN